VAYSFRYIVHVFFGARRDDYPHTPHDPPAGMWLPPALLVVLVVAIGLFPTPWRGRWWRWWRAPSPAGR
jgi:multicomponent K+:H+ antiporter subunit A